MPMFCLTMEGEVANETSALHDIQRRSTVQLQGIDRSLIDMKQTPVPLYTSANTLRDVRRSVLFDRAILSWSNFKVVSSDMQAKR